jgi:hypothetical protein
VIINLSKISGAQDPGRSRKPKRAVRGGFSWLSQTGRLSRRSPSVCAGHGRGAAPVRPGHSWFPSAPGIREFWRVFDYLAEMCVWASSRPIRAGAGTPILRASLGVVASLTK